MTNCKICGNRENLIFYEVKEMMFGLREKFSYFQCPKCDCLQITEIPQNLDKYYPDNYYSFNSNFVNLNTKSFKNRLISRRNKYAILKKGIFNKLLFKKYPTEIFEPLALAKINRKTSILDVGCGGGKLLFILKNIGFKNLTGIDPFNQKDIHKNGVKILKEYIMDINGKWEFIMFNHSFEHMENPLETLKKVYELLDEEGQCMIRIPISSSFAWEHYRENWVQLDAPRHFFLHSLKSINLLAEEANLKVEKIFFDSEEFQFWGSEQYLKDIPLISKESYKFNKQGAIFSSQQLKEFKKRSIKLNEEQRGDMCAFYLRKNTNKP